MKKNLHYISFSIIFFLLIYISSCAWEIFTVLNLLSSDIAQISFPVDVEMQTKTSYFYQSLLKRRNCVSESEKTVTKKYRLKITPNKDISVTNGFNRFSQKCCQQYCYLNSCVWVLLKIKYSTVLIRVVLQGSHSNRDRCSVHKHCTFLNGIIPPIWQQCLLQPALTSNDCWYSSFLHITK